MMGFDPGGGACGEAENINAGLSMLVRRGQPSNRASAARLLGDVIQDLKPFLSSESIRQGRRWSLSE
jgi:hypothetical protein